MAWSVTADPVDFKEAIDWFSKRIAMTRAERDRQTAESRHKAFFVSNVAQADLVNQAWKAIDSAVKNGTTLEDFKKDIGTQLRAAWGSSVDNPGWRLETIFRTNVQHAYAAGRFKQASDPAVLSDRPFWMFDAILDGRETRICQLCDGTKLPADDPWWQTHTPPLHFNCRSSIITLPTAVLTKRPTQEEPQDGFGLSPADDGWQPDLAKYPAPIQQIAKQKIAKAPPPPPPPKLVDGVHIRTVVAPGIPRAQIERILGSVSESETLAFLHNAPIRSLNILPNLRYQGKNVEGLYWSSGVTKGKLDLRSNLGPDSFGRPWTPGGTWTVSSAAKTKAQAEKIIFRHELGHHVHMHDGVGSAVDRIVELAFDRADQAGKFLTEYASTNRNEYFAECYAAYYHRRRELKRFDPNGFTMVEDVLRERGILP